jgi:hypothetical protein
MLSPIYAAGFFDGEGCISLMYCRRRAWKSDPSKVMYGFRLAVLVANTDREILDVLSARWGGHVTIGNPRRGTTHKAVHSWRLNGAETQQRFLAEIRPYARVKAKQIDLALDYLRTSGTLGQRVSQKDWDVRIACYEALATLNRRGSQQRPLREVPSEPALGLKPARFYSAETLATNMRKMRSARVGSARTSGARAITR